MRRYLIGLCVFMVFGWTHAALAWPARVVHVSDGDTVHVEPIKGGKRIKVRLYGVDCPESRQPYGQAATGFVSDLALFKIVDVQPYDTDRYGRTVAVLAIGESTAQDALLDAGLAWVYTRYCKIPQCAAWKDKEKAAARARRGLWRDLDGASKPVAPWTWRSRGR
ncbi:thermonuclease family protein [Desulfovibrio sp. OttesenSCG-928-A18]|nr:thermonuclease family protein [Desulfovibrio sp. OttesenSCG-928-A18]